MTQDPLVIGAALKLPALEALRDWLFARDRDVEIQDFFLPGALDGDWTPLAARCRALLDGHRGRIGLHGPFHGLDLAAEERLVAEIARKRLGQGLEVCAAVGATQMVLHSPFTNWDAQNLDDGVGLREAKIAQVLDTLAPVVARAADQGVELVLENIEDRDPAERRRLAEAFCATFGEGTVKLSVDTGHAQCAHASYAAPPVDYFIRDAGAALAHVHLQDVDGWADRHWPIGDGSIPWRAVFAAVAETVAASEAEIGARPRLLLELRGDRGVVESAERLAAMGLAV